MAIVFPREHTGLPVVIQDKASRFRGTRLALMAGFPATASYQTMATRARRTSSIVAFVGVVTICMVEVQRRRTRRVSSVSASTSGFSPNVRAVASSLMATVTTSARSLATVRVRRSTWVMVMGVAFIPINYRSICCSCLIGTVPSRRTKRKHSSGLRGIHRRTTVLIFNEHVGH